MRREICDAIGARWMLEFDYGGYAADAVAIVEDAIAELDAGRIDAAKALAGVLGRHT